MEKIYTEGKLHQMHNFHITFITLLPKNQCYLFGYLPDDKETMLMLMCKLEIFNGILEKVNEDVDDLFDFVNNRMLNKTKSEFTSSIKKFTKKKVLVLDNFSIMAKAIEKEGNATPFFIEEVFQIPN